MDKLMTPENAAVLIAAIAGLVGAFGFGIRQLSAAFNSWIETRNKVRMMVAENQRLREEVSAREQDAENERDTKIINILERLTEQNGRWPPIAEDFATAQNRQIEVIEQFRQTNEKVAVGLANMATENKALRISMESWPKAVDSHLEGVAKKVEALETTVGLLLIAVNNGNEDHEFVRQSIDDRIVPMLTNIRDLVQPKAPPPPGAAQEPPANVKPLNADAGDHSAPRLKKTGTGP